MDYNTTTLSLRLHRQSNYSSQLVPLSKVTVCNNVCIHKMLLSEAIIAMEVMLYILLELYTHCNYSNGKNR